MFLNSFLQKSFYFPGNILVKDIISLNWDLFLSKHITQQEIFIPIQFLINQDNHFFWYKKIVIIYSSIVREVDWDCLSNSPNPWPLASQF